MNFLKIVGKILAENFIGFEFSKQVFFGFFGFRSRWNATVSGDSTSAGLWLFKCYIHGQAVVVSLAFISVLDSANRRVPTSRSQSDKLDPDPSTNPTDDPIMIR